jgi:glutamate synthase (NADPH/NADH) large chain/glutamate synthase (ferredoxin)
VISYKGLLLSPSLQLFYRDLENPHYETAIALYHQRYSTNTFPTWPLSQPFRMLAHNGEINTRRGNVNWMRAREAELQAGAWGEDIEFLKPIIQPGGSDSAELDNSVEALVMSGRSVLHAMTMLVPPAWRSHKELAPELKAFFEYHSCFNEPWDGPARLYSQTGSRSERVWIGTGFGRLVTRSPVTGLSPSAPRLGQSCLMTSASWRRAGSPRAK